MKSPASRATFFALITALTLIAVHIAGKATRDAIFLSIYDVTVIPTMLMVSSATSLIGVLLMTRLLSTFGPSKVVPKAFFLSVGLFVAEISLLESLPKIASVILYVHIATFGAILISGFWSVINEKFDPFSAKKYIGIIAGGATIGGLLGGVLTERVAAQGEMTLMIPILAGMHLLGGVCLWLVTLQSTINQKQEPPSDTNFLKDYKKLLASDYLRNIALLILLLTTSGAIVDYLMKGQAVAAYGKGDELLRFFAVFYTGLGFVTLVFQFLVTKWFLRKFDNGVAVGTVPGLLTVGGIANFFVPGLVASVALKGLEQIFRNSIYRSGYELLYGPVPKAEKRNGKMLIDVGVDKLADAVGGGLISLVLLVVTGAVANSVLAVLVSVTGFLAFIVSRSLFKGYVRQLEKNLSASEGAVENQKAEAKRMVETLTAIQFDLTQYLEPEEIKKAIDKTENSSALAADEEKVEDPLLTQDPQALKEHLAAISETDLTREQVSKLIDLLSWNEVYKDVIHLLRERLENCEATLIARYLAENEDFAIRRRLPRVLQMSNSDEVFVALLKGLSDSRFEVRYQTSVALQSVQKRNSSRHTDSELIFKTIIREIELGQAKWNKQKVVDVVETSSDSMMSLELQEFVRRRAGRSMDYVFRLLSLVYPSNALMTSYYGLFTDDELLQGTALEYLDSVLEDDVKKALWPLIDSGRKGELRPRLKEEVEKEILNTQASMVTQIRQLAEADKTSSDSPTD